MYCPKCGTEQISEGNFCHKCGCKIIRENEAEVNISNKESYKCVDNQTTISKKNDSKFKHKKILVCSIIAIISIIVGVSVFIYKYTADRTVFNQKPSVSDSKESIEEQLKSVVNLNLKAMQDEDLDKYLSTIIIPDEQISQTKEAMIKLFKDYDLQYTIEDSKVLTTDSDDAQVQVVQTTKKLQGGDFRDNRVTAIHHLKQSNGQWRIFKTDTKNIEYIVEDELKAVINSNLQAFQEENLDKYLSTVIISNEQMAQTKETLKKLFKDYDLQYTIEDPKVLTTDNEDAQVQVVQTTKKLQGLDFKDNRITVIHHLKQTNNQWKIFKTDVKNLEYINETSNTQNDAEISKKQSIQKSIIGRWTDESTTQVILTESTFNGCQYNVIKVENNKFTIEVTEKTGKYKYMIVLTQNDLMMLYIFNDVTNSYTGGSQLKRID